MQLKCKINILFSNQGTYTLKLYLTGDLDFHSKMYGLSDASGICECISPLENRPALLVSNRLQLP